MAAPKAAGKEEQSSYPVTALAAEGEVSRPPLAPKTTRLRALLKHNTRRLPLLAMLGAFCLLTGLITFSIGAGDALHYFHQLEGTVTTAGNSDTMVHIYLGLVVATIAATVALLVFVVTAYALRWAQKSRQAARHGKGVHSRRVYSRYRGLAIALTVALFLLAAWYVAMVAVNLTGMLAVASIANSAEGGSALLSDVANTVAALQSTTDTAANPLSALLGGGTSSSGTEDLSSLINDLLGSSGTPSLAGLFGLVRGMTLGSVLSLIPTTPQGLLSFAATVYNSVEPSVGTPALVCASDACLKVTLDSFWTSRVCICNVEELTALTTLGRAAHKDTIVALAGAALLYVGATLLLACTANEVAQITFGRDILHTTAYDRYVARRLAGNALQMEGVSRGELVRVSFNEKPAFEGSKNGSRGRTLSTEDVQPLELEPASP